jgi:Fe-S-cluster containining protein
MSSTNLGARRPPFELSGPAEAVRATNELIRTSEVLLERHLQRERSLAALSVGAAEALQLADQKLADIYRAIARSTALDPTGSIKCTKGCSHCCYRIPELTVPELSVLWQRVSSSFSTVELTALKERTDRYLTDTAPFRPDRLMHANIACPLLVNGTCSVYSVRPLSCRGYNSTKVSSCESISAGKLASKARPQWSDPYMVTFAIRMGLRLGAFFESMDPITVDLGVALQILLEDSDALEQYVRGRNSFRVGEAGVESEDFDANKISAVNGPARLSDQESSRPSGNLSAQEAALLSHAGTDYLVSGDFQAYMNRLDGRSVGRAMARINVPRVAMSEEEIDEARSNYLRAILAFEDSGFAPAESFNALSFHQTMNLAYQGRDDLEILRRHGQFVAGIASRAVPGLVQPLKARKPGKVRVGYVSASLNASNNGRWAWPWLKHHSKELETFCFFVGEVSDPITERFSAHSDHFFWLNRSVPQNASFIRSQDLDVLIFTDIGLHGRIAQYSALRLARAQCTAWGGPETSGLPTIDYYISSEYMEPPDGERFYSEKLVKLPRSGMLFLKEPWKIPDLDRAHFGISDSRPFLLMAQACMKLVPKYDHVLARICDRAGCEIVFLESDPQGDSNVVRRRLERVGVRARWLPAVSSAEYLALLKLADVSIDTHMWSGGNTTVQALTLGTPVVSWPGPFMRGRHSLAFLRQANALGLIAASEDEFVELACDFERQRDEAGRLNADELYGDVDVIRALDQFILSVAGESSTN